jgi:hypothetical protein
MWNLYKNFLQGMAVNWLGRIGIILTTSSFLLFIFLESASLAGIFTNVYLGIISYLILPLIFIFGLILIPIAWVAYKKKQGKSSRELLTKRFSLEMTDNKNYWSHLFTVIGLLTIANVLFLSIASLGALKFMDEPTFCGTACHRVMNPEWVTYQQSPHARVKCVECHVGEGFNALIGSKINGAWQVISLFFNLYERPIPTPVHNLRPSRHTCEKCHWPEKFYGGRLKTVVRYQQDIHSSPLYSTLKLKVDQGKKVGDSGIHWHISNNAEVKYASVDDLRREITVVKVKDQDGSTREYRNTNFPNQAISEQEMRTMDCVDCHNRATHIYEDPAQAIDERIFKGVLDTSLPYLKSIVLSALKKQYPDIEQAKTGIKNRINSFYENQLAADYPLQTAKIENTIKIAIEIYERNIHPQMNIFWNSYPNHIGHQHHDGCFRCHNHFLKEVGSNQSISQDCTVCHSLLALQSQNPFQFLYPPIDTDKEKTMHLYLQQEFLRQDK